MSWPKTTVNIYYLLVSLSQEVGNGLAGGFLLRIVHEVAVMVVAGLWSSGGLSGAGGPTSRMGHSHGFW